MFSGMLLLIIFPTFSYTLSLAARGVALRHLGQEGRAASQDPFVLHRLVCRGSDQSSKTVSLCASNPIEID